MRRALLMVALAGISCSSDGDGSTGSGSDAPTVFVEATGTVSNPVSPAQSGRLIVGVAKAADVSQQIVCNKLLVKFEKNPTTLPSAFQLQRVPAGDLVLVALLIDGSGKPQMPGAAYEVTADVSGVRFKNAPVGSSLDVC